MKTTLKVLILNVLVIPLVRGSCDTFLYDIVSCYDLFDVRPTTAPDSIISICDQYYPMCYGTDVFLQCYYTAINSCNEDKRKYNPLLMEYSTVQSVLYGCCRNKQVFSDGKACLGDQYVDIHKLISYYCFRFDDVNRISTDAVLSGNWTDFCSTVDESFNCIQSVIYPFNCTEDYNQATKHVVYAAMPPYCRNDSDAFHWLDVNEYQMNTADVITGWTAKILMIPSLVYIYQLIDEFH